MEILPRPSSDHATFIRANTRRRTVPLVPEISLHVADEAVPIWRKTEEELDAMGLPPPFWAFAWAGGQALARYILDHPDAVRGRRVLDLAAGSGLVGIAAMKAGASSVTAADIDAFAAAAIAINATDNDVIVGVCTDDLLMTATDDTWDVIVAGDIFYERDTAARAFAFLSHNRDRGARVLIGDPGRAYLPKEKLQQLADYGVPVTRDLEDSDIKRTAVWTIG